MHGKGYGIRNLGPSLHGKGLLSIGSIYFQLYSATAFCNHHGSLNRLWKYLLATFTTPWPWSFSVTNKSRSRLVLDSLAADEPKETLTTAKRWLQNFTSQPFLFAISRACYPLESLDKSLSCLCAAELSQVYQWLRNPDADRTSYLLQLSALFSVEPTAVSMKVATLENPAGSSSHSSNLIPLPSE